VNSTLFEVKEEKVNCRGLFNLRHLKPYLEENLSANDKQIIENKFEQINKGVTEAVSERQELRTEVLNVDSVRSLDDLSRLAD
jgi:hypothetical protein